MSLLQMSFSGAIMILAVMVVRAVAMNKLPKKVFVLLWEMVLLRLLIPFSIPFSFSVYSLMAKLPLFAGGATLRENVFPEMTVGTGIPQMEVLLGQMDVAASGALQGQTQMTLQNALSGFLSLSPWTVIWFIGMLLCGIFFAVSYFRCYGKFSTSLPVKNEAARNWLEIHTLRRPLQIRQSDRISAPLTYGIFRPVILMPKGTDWENAQQLQYILLHEYVHICRFDMVAKLITVLALCIHWFNPMVWILYLLFNRDMELSCDERVVHRLGENTRASYARTLIAMEEKKSGFMPLYNNFSKNAIEERITSIMKSKKVTTGAVIISVVLLVTVVVVFATSAKNTTSAENMEVPTVVLEDEAVKQAEAEAAKRAEEAMIVKEALVRQQQELLEEELRKVEKPMEGDDWLKIIGEVEETADRKIVYEMAKESTADYFQETDAVTIYGIKGLSNVQEEIGGKCTVQVEFLASGEDSLTYFSMIFEKQETGWKLCSYGLEK